LSETPPLIAGASQQDEQPAPRKPPPKLKQQIAPRPLPIKEADSTQAPPAAAPNNGNETKSQTVLAETASLSQPAGPPPDYIGLIRARLEQVKRYPPEARRERQEGTVTMRFTLDRSGRVLSSHIQRSSGAVDLDEEATQMVDRAAPFPPFPRSLERSTLDLMVPIEFVLK